MKLLLTSLFLFVLCGARAQGSFGYFGKKNVVTINVTGCIPMVYWFMSGPPSYKATPGGSLSKGKDLFDGGFLISASHAFSGSFGLGIEYGMNFGNIAAPVDVYHSSSYYSGSDLGYFPMLHEQIKVRTTTILPKIEYTFQGEQLPIGINNQVGIGFSTTKLIEDDYIVKPQLDEFQAASYDPEKLINYNMKPVSGITLLYAFNVRTPISRSLLLNYGIRYTLNVEFAQVQNYYDSSGGNNYYVQNEEIRREMGRKRLASIIMLNFGLNYVF